MELLNSKDKTNLVRPISFRVPLSAFPYSTKLKFTSEVELDFGEVLLSHL